MTSLSKFSAHGAYDDVIGWDDDIICYVHLYAFNNHRMAGRILTKFGMDIMPF
jgi:hypothetical protein